MFTIIENFRSRVSTTELVSVPSACWQDHRRSTPDKTEQLRVLYSQQCTKLVLGSRVHRYYLNNYSLQ